MNKRSLIAFSVAFLAIAGTTSNAFSQEKTRAEVRQELIQAETQGLQFVTDTSYPEVNPIFKQQVARLQLQGSGTGAPMGGSSAAGKQAITAVASTAAPSSCVGPSDYCTPYFGS